MKFLDERKRGGIREGAGRKAKQEGSQRVPLSARVAPETKARLDALAISTGKSLGAVLDDLAAPAVER